MAPGDAPVGGGGGGGRRRFLAAARLHARRHGAQRTLAAPDWPWPTRRILIDLLPLSRCSHGVLQPRCLRGRMHHRRANPTALVRGAAGSRARSSRTAAPFIEAAVEIQPLRRWACTGRSGLKWSRVVPCCPPKRPEAIAHAIGASGLARHAVLYVGSRDRRAGHASYNRPRCAAGLVLWERALR